jgi:uncharacterized protein YcfL
MKKIWIIFIILLLLISCSKSENWNNNENEKQVLIDSEDIKVPVMEDQPNF